MPKKNIQHKCEIFRCRRRRSKYCCFYCPQKGKCENHCLNHPERCGQMYEVEAGKRREKKQ